MAILPLTYAPNKIFQTKAEKVTEVTDEIRKIIDDMFETLYHHKALGIGANMVGILKHIIVVDMQDGTNSKYAMINPEIEILSDEIQIFEEASLCFLGISAKIKRPSKIKVEYLDYNGEKQIMEADGFLSTVIQHETDYLNAITFLDHLSKMKRDILVAKMRKNSN